MTLSKSLVIILISLFLITVSLSAREIHDAALKGDLEKVKAFLEINPGLVNAKDENGNSPLHLAARGDHTMIAKLLLARGADINQTNINGDTPLHWAAQFGKVKATELLLGKGIDINQKNVYGWTPLFYAIVMSQTETTELLINKGADLSIESDGGMTAFEWVSHLRFYNKKMIDFLISGGFNVPEKKRYMNDMLHSAAYHGHKEFVHYLLRKGVDIKSRNNNNGTFLHSASAGGLVDYVQLILRKGSDVNEKDRYSLTPLLLAASGGHLEVVKLLIENKANVNLHSVLGKTALHYAKENNHQEIVDFLISNGAHQNPPKFSTLSGGYLGQKKPGLKPEIFAPGIISSSRYEHTSIAFSPDGNEVYWSTEYIGFSGCNIFFMSLKDNRWTPPQIAPFSIGQWDINPAFSQNGKKLYFTSFRPLSGARPGNIWFVEKIGPGWSKPKPLPLNINTYQTEEGVSVSKNGNLYFASRRMDGKGERDIYCSQFINGHYQNPENLGDSINTNGYESFPYIAPDESYLIFDSGRPGNFGSSDIYISFRRNDGTWAKARNMGNVINSQGEDRFASVSPDGKFLFYASDKNGNMDIYWVDAKIIDELRPKIKMKRDKK